VAYGPEKFRWLRDNFTPVEHVAHAVLVYRVSNADLERIARGQRKPAVTEPTPERQE
jgi:hypothetical protein